MSARLDNSPDEIGDLLGATIEAIWIEKDEMFYGMEEVIRFRVKYRDGLGINDSAHGEYELWQDGEGNGPGFLAFVKPVSA